LKRNNRPPSDPTAYIGQDDEQHQGFPFLSHDEMTGAGNEPGNRTGEDGMHSAASPPADSGDMNSQFTRTAAAGTTRATEDADYGVSAGHW
jgi:hypothetical protein